MCSYQPPPAYPFILVQFTNAAPEAHQCQSKISPLATSFTQRRRWRIGTGTPHSKGGVNGAYECSTEKSSRFELHREISQCVHMILKETKKLR